MIKKFLNLSKRQKIISFIILGLIIIAISIAIPTLANFKNATISGDENVVYWDGSIATSYNSGIGSESDPYVISSASQLAYFSEQLENNDYANTYFVLGNNILLNEGLLKYNSNDGITYILNGMTYYVSEYSNNYYETSARNGNPSGTINIFPTLDNFKGNLSGNGYTISGLYITKNNASELGLFTNLEGSLSNIQIVNSLVYGGIITGGVAGSATNATLNNILFDGFVVGTNQESNKTITLNPPDLVVNMLSASPETIYIDILNTLDFIGGEVVSGTISGYFSPTTGPAQQMNITVNGVRLTTGNKAASFGPDNIGTNVQNLPVIGTIGNNNGSATLSNLVYTVTYNYAATGGIIGHNSGSTLTNVINKSEVNGEITSGGIVGTSTNNLNIEKSYNNGVIRGGYSSGGLAGKIEKSLETNISQSYNTASLDPVSINSGGIVGIAFNNSGEINISNVFNTASNHTLGTTQHSDINVTNSNYIYETPIGSGEVNGEFTAKTNDVLHAKDVLIEMGFYEFISEDNYALNPQNCWVYEGNEFPLIYNDNKLKPLANIYVGNHIFSELSQNLDTKLFNSNITFTVEEANIFQPITEKMYYISSSTTALTQTELENITNWTPVLDINQISTEGPYVIYVKVSDRDNNISYLNTDSLILDLTSPQVNVTLENEETWNDLRNNLNNIHIGKELDLTVTATDSLSDIKEIFYYSTSQVLDEVELNNLSVNDWKEYVDKIPLQNGTNIFYIKVVDNAGNVTYVNTDNIILIGYTYSNFFVGTKSTSYEDTNYITNKSKITMDLNYTATNASVVTGYHKLISNILLPQNTKIVLMDKETNKIYEYTIPTSDDNYNYENSCSLNDLECTKVATYPLTLFKEVGNLNADLFYEEKTYHNNGSIIENFRITLDFSNTNILNDYYDVALHLELQDNNNETIRPTISDTIQSFNIISSINGGLPATTLTTSKNYNNTTIPLNPDSYTEINLSSNLEYPEFNNNRVIDTTYESMKMGLLIKLTNSSGTVIAQNHLENLTIKIGNNAYTPDETGLIKIPINNELITTNQTLTIETYEHETTLSPGTYYFKIATYLSYNNHPESNLISNEESIPVIVVNNEIIETHSFDLVMDKTKHLINKTDNSAEIDFDLILSNNFANPNIRVSLYSKNQLTAYNQNYSIINLQNYVANSLTQNGANNYNVPLDSTNKFKLYLNTSKFDYNGYKLVFDLYDGNTRIDQVKKYFIVK